MTRQPRIMKGACSRLARDGMVVRRGDVKRSARFRWAARHAVDALTKSLLMNDEVIAVSQDRLGKTARRIRHTDAESVWVRPLTGGFKAVALVNRSPVAREMRFTFKEIGLGGMCYVKDLWRQKCEGKHGGSYTALVPPHATKLVKTRPVDCAKCE